MILLHLARLRNRGAPRAPDEAGKRRKESLEKATLDTINSGVMTKDLALLYEGEAKSVNSREFLAEIRGRLEA